MSGVWTAGAAAAAGLAAMGIRICLELSGRPGPEETGGGYWEAAAAQTRGKQEIQADQAQYLETGAGIMAVLTDGTGSRNTGRVCAQLAADTILDRYEPYQVLHNPDYFFKTAFYEANSRIQKTTGERRGGASTGAVFLDRRSLSYGLAGNIRIALLRRGELIPLSRGQTLDVLAADAWKAGKITRQDAVWSMEEKRVWNYVGMDGFHEIETGERPVLLKSGDIILMASRGVYEELSWRETEDILVSGLPVQEAAGQIIRAAEAKASPDQDNGSVILIKVKEGTP